MKAFTLLFLAATMVTALPSDADNISAFGAVEQRETDTDTACNDDLCVTVPRSLVRRKGRADAAAVLADIGNYYSSQYEAEKQDNIRRRDFTRGLAAKLRDDTGCNVFVNNVAYSVSAPCDWVDQAHIDLKRRDATKVTFSICFADKLTYTRRGDGGYENWAWAPASSGSCTAQGDGHIVECHYSSPRLPKQIQSNMLRRFTGIDYMLTLEVLQPVLRRIEQEVLGKLIIYFNQDRS
ncbi:hypothetical protein B0O99DRAFT_675295 [Bisporella sp. PMI_857]|nr:hypothetical protein B0O99DRAFT_675295 [Bisporella sp. PMI_857]